MMNLFKQRNTSENTDEERNTDIDDKFGSICELELTEKEPEPMCNITTNKNLVVICSNASPNPLLKFDQGSFCFQSNDSQVQLQFNPMFLWRLVNFQDVHLKKDNIDLDFIRIRTFTSKCISSGRTVDILISEKNISYKQYGNTVTQVLADGFLYTNTIQTFDRLYLSMKRNYESYDVLASMFDACIHILYYLSY